jgi:glycosyltransferase involved in cell wall biosynthesis
VPSCSIIIRAYNEAEHIGRLLAGIQQQTVQDCEMILVDSGSTDDTLSIASQYPVQIVQISPQEFSFGRSLNCGIQAAHSDLIVIASAHVYPVYPDWLERLLAPFADPKVAVAYGKQRGNQVTLFSEQQVFQQWYPDEPRPLQAHPFCNNANAAVRRRLWEEHPYDETLPGLEDVEWAHWALEAGQGLAYVPEAEVIHVHHETPRGIYNRYRREAMAFKRIFPDERFGLLDFVRLFAANSVSDLWHAARQNRLARSFGSILWFRWMQFWGTYRGYHQPAALTWQLRQTFYYPRLAASPPQTTTRRGVKPIQYSD